MLALCRIRAGESSARRRYISRQAPTERADQGGVTVLDTAASPQRQRSYPRNARTRVEYPSHLCATMLQLQPIRPTLSQIDSF